MRLEPGSLPFTVLLGALTAMTAIAIDMSLPALPALAAAFATAPDRVQLTLSLFAIGYGAGQLLSGPLSDRFGRKPVLLGGLGIYTLAGLAAALAPGIAPLVMARLLQGLGAAVGPILGRAIVRDHWSGVRAAQALSHVMVVFALAPMVAPLIGAGLLRLWGWRSIFLTFAVFGGVLALVTWLVFAESLRTPDRLAMSPARLFANARRFFADRRCVGYMLVNSCIFVGLFVFISASPFVFIAGYGVTPGAFGLYFALGAFAIMAGALANGRLVRRLPPERVLRSGLIVLSLSGAAALVIGLSRWSGPLAMMAAIMGYIFAQGLTMPNAIAGAMEPLPQMAGMVASRMGAAQRLAGGLAGYAVNLLYDGTAVPMAAFIAAMGIGALLTYYFLLLPGGSAARPA